MYDLLAKSSPKYLRSEFIKLSTISHRSTYDYTSTLNKLPVKHKEYYTASKNRPIIHMAMPQS